MYKQSLKNIEACIFDWAGTMVDFGSFAPTQVLIDAFSDFGIIVTMAQARVPMGKAKRAHIKAITEMPEITAQWQAIFQAIPSEQDIDEIYARFMPLQIAKVAEYSQPIVGSVNVLNFLRQQNIKLGSCTGYPRQVMKHLIPFAKTQGIEMDEYICSDDLKAGARPGPWMALQNVINLGINTVNRCVKIDDTPVGMQEGRNAGMWCVGLAISGNEVGLSPAEWDALSATDQQNHRQRASEQLFAKGAHIVIDSIEHLPHALADIDQRISVGGRP